MPDVSPLSLGTNALRLVHLIWHRLLHCLQAQVFAPPFSALISE